MANIQPRYNKDGELISFSIRVHRGRTSTGKQLTPYTTTFEVNPKWTAASALKKAQAFAAVFEKNCKEGTETTSRFNFQDYAEYVLALKEKRGIKHSTLQRYRELAVRVYKHLGHIKIKDIKPHMLNDFYTYLLFEDKNLKTGKNLSEKTVLEHHRFISTVLEQALKEGEVTYNAAKRADPPKVKRKEINYFQPEDLKKITEAMKQESI